MEAEPAAAAPAEELEDPRTVITTVIAIVVAAAFLWTAFSFRMHRKARDAAIRAKREELNSPTQKDVEHVRKLLSEQVGQGTAVTLETLLRDVASAPTLRKLGEKTMEEAQRKLRKLHGLLQKKGISAEAAGTGDGEAVVRLLLAYKMNSALQLADTELDEDLFRFYSAISEGVLYILASVYEASVKAKWLSPALVALSLQACLRSVRSPPLTNVTTIHSSACGGGHRVCGLMRRSSVSRLCASRWRTRARLSLR